MEDLSMDESHAFCASPDSIKTPDAPAEASTALASVLYDGCLSLRLPLAFSPYSHHVYRWRTAAKEAEEKSSWLSDVQIRQEEVRRRTPSLREMRKDEL
jgi:hypothetical protein